MATQWPCVGCCVLCHRVAARASSGRLGNICLMQQPRLCHSAGGPGPGGPLVRASRNPVRISLHPTGAGHDCRSRLHVAIYSTSRSHSQRRQPHQVRSACRSYPRDDGRRGYSLYRRLRWRARHGSRSCSLYPRLRRRYGRFFPRPLYRFVCPQVSWGGWSLGTGPTGNPTGLPAAATALRPWACYPPSCERSAPSSDPPWAYPTRGHSGASRRPEGHPQGRPVVRLSRDHPDGHYRPRGWSMWVVAWVVGPPRRPISA